MPDLIDQVKTNLVLTHDLDDTLIAHLIGAATSCATAYQHLPDAHYDPPPRSGTTRQAIITLASHFYEFRGGATAGYWADKPETTDAVWNAVNTLPRLDRDWKI